MFPMTCLMGVEGLWQGAGVGSLPKRIEALGKRVVPVRFAVGEVAVGDPDVVLVLALVETERGLVAAPELAVALGGVEPVSNRQLVESLEVGVGCGVPCFIVELPDHGDWRKTIEMG